MTEHEQVEKKVDPSSCIRNYSASNSNVYALAYCSVAGRNLDSNASNAHLIPTIWPCIFVGGAIVLIHSSNYRHTHTQTYMAHIGK